MKHDRRNPLAAALASAPPPVRLRLSRRAGFNLVALSQAINGRGALGVTRPGPFGNPFRIGGYFRIVDPQSAEAVKGVRLWQAGAGAADARFRYVPDAATAVALYRQFLDAWGPPAGLARLEGLNLACHCGLCPAHAAKGKPFDVSCDLCRPCHSDLLGRLANQFSCDAPSARKAAL